MAFLVESREAISDVDAGSCSVVVLKRYVHYVDMRRDCYQRVDSSILCTDLRGCEYATLGPAFPDGLATCKWHVVWMMSRESDLENYHVSLILKSTRPVPRLQIKAAYTVKSDTSYCRGTVKQRHTFVVGVPSPTCVFKFRRPRSIDNIEPQHRPAGISVTVEAEVETKDAKKFTLRQHKKPSRVCVLQDVDNKRFSDVTLRVKSVEIPAHRIVLATKSPKFAEMLKSTPVSKPFIDIEDFELDTVRAMISFLYRGYDYLRPTLRTSSVALKLWKLSRKYEIKDLQVMCEAYLLSNMQSIQEAEELLLTAGDRDTQVKIVDYLFAKYSVSDCAEVFKRIAEKRPEVAVSLLRNIPSVIASSENRGGLC